MVIPMITGKIRKLAREIPEDLRSVETFIINDAYENTERHIQDYNELESSHGSRYVCTDLMKETYPVYCNSIESRRKYGGVVHNSCACLAAEVFERKIKDPSIKKCIFLTGTPGAGKSYLIQSIIFSGVLNQDVMVYEGDITTPTIKEKMQMVKDLGKDIFVLVVNPTLELAESNAIRRYLEVGRSAPHAIIARIMSKLPNAIRELSQEFDITLGIFNKQTNYDTYNTVGMEEIDTLDHGTYDEIMERLETLYEELFPIVKAEVERQNGTTLEESEVQEYERKIK